MSDQPNAAHMPLFYKAPEPLSATSHGTWRLRGGDYGFAADTPFVPIVAGEVAHAARSYPIVFGAGDGHPIAILGVERENLFVADGLWADDAHVPAYVRRYPFGFIATVNPDGFALAIDGGSERIVRDAEEGIALFEDGKPGDLTRQALAFCDAFQGEAAATRAFADALVAEELLVDRRADVTLPDGRKLGLEGFQIIDMERFAALPDERVLDWHRKGWLALVHFHAASLDRFDALLARRQTRSAAAQISSEQGAAEAAA